MKPGLSLRVSQHLSLTPQLQQSIRLLQLSTLELTQEVEQMLDENPFLERAQDEADREEFGLSQVDAMVSEGDRITEFAAMGDSYSNAASEALPDDLPSTELTEPSWEGDGGVDVSPDDSEWGGDAPARQAVVDDEDRDATEWTRPMETLQQHLKRQAAGLRLSAEDAAALQFLIESINDDGYLEDSLEVLAQSLRPQGEEQLQELLHHFKVALGLLHSLEPVGVGARDLGECLRLQLLARKQLLQQNETANAINSLALSICQQPVEMLARRDIKRLVSLCGASEAQVRLALGVINRLEPKPGRPFVEVERNIVVPDVIVTLQRKPASSNTSFRVRINPDIMPRVRVSDVYASALRQQRGNAKEGSAGYGALQQRLQEARWFLNSIQQRFDTILRVSTAIVERQKSFFTHGALAMRPLVLREIADELGLHESTISRVTTAKFMATPQGTFELKYFFGSGLGTESGGNASSTAVRALIKQFISAENPSKPLSDSQLADMLKEQGIDCARRTVAKYREGLKIAVASLRKTL